MNFWCGYLASYKITPIFAPEFKLKAYDRRRKIPQRAW